MMSFPALRFALVTLFFVFHQSHGGERDLIAPARSNRNISEKSHTLLWSTNGSGIEVSHIQRIEFYRVDGFRKPCTNANRVLRLVDKDSIATFMQVLRKEDNSGIQPATRRSHRLILIFYDPAENIVAVLYLDRGYSGIGITAELYFSSDDSFHITGSKRVDAMEAWLEEHSIVLLVPPVGPVRRTAAAEETKNGVGVIHLGGCQETKNPSVPQNGE